MVNSPEAYYEAGKKAAIARNHNDEYGFRDWRSWHARARALESDENRRIANEEYERGWNDHRHIVRFEPFK